MATIENQTVKIDARPEPIPLDTARAAVLVIDMQHDFASAGGMFDRQGIDVRIIRAAIEPTRKVLDAARAAGIPIVYIKMEHLDGIADGGADDAPHRIKHRHMRLGEEFTAPDGTQGHILTGENWNTDILPEIAPQPGDIIVTKHRYSAFFETNLDSVLRTLRAKYLIVTGCTTSVCVESTIRDAMFRDYACLLLEDCTAEPVGFDLERSNHDASLMVIERLFGWVSNSSTLIEALKSSKTAKSEKIATTG